MSFPEASNLGVPTSSVRDASDASPRGVLLGEHSALASQGNTFDWSATALTGPMRFSIRFPEYLVRVAIFERLYRRCRAIA
jgi:hypothetical protein